MENIFVARIMSTDVHSVMPDTLVEDAASLMLEEDIGSVVVVDGDNHLEGILTTKDFVRIVAESQPKAETTVSRYMTTDLEIAGAQDKVIDVAETMTLKGIHHVPVVDDTEGVIGIITSTDLTAYLSNVEPSSVA